MDLEPQFVPRKMGTVVPVSYGVMSNFLRYFGGSRDEESADGGGSDLASTENIERRLAS